MFARTAALRWARWAALLAAGLCLLVLSAWFAGFDALTRLAPGLPSMKVNTALAFALLSVSTLRVTFGPSRLPLLGAPLAALLAALTLWQSLSGTDLGIDQWLLIDLGTPEAEQPGRMAVMTSVAALLLSLSAIFLHHCPPRCQRWHRLPTFAALAIAYVASVGFLIAGPWTGWLHDVMGSLSLPTATVVLLLGAALLKLDGLREEPRPWVPATSQAGLRFAQVALPMALLVPAAIGWLREVGVRQGLLPTADGQALAFAALGLLFGMLVLAAAAWVSQFEGSLRANEALLESRVLERTAQVVDAERRADHALKRLTQVVQQVDVGIIAVDRSHRVLLFNAAAERMFGVTAAQMVGQPLDRLLPPERGAEHGRWMADFERSGVVTRRMGGNAARVQGVRVDGSRFVIEAMISRSGAADETLLTAVVRDLTLPLALEAARRAREAAESASRAKSHQIGLVSHELRTPLNAVIGFSDLLLMNLDEALDERHRMWVGQIQRAGRHMLQVIGDLTELSRIDAGLEAQSIVSLDAVAAVAAVSALLAPTAAAVHVTLNGPGTTDRTCLVRADERRLRQVLLNLVGNAIKYNRAGGRVALRVEPAATDELVIRVEDSGIGLQPEQLARLFEPFNRLGRERSEVEGTGLGLVLTRSLVLAMHGRIEVRSEAGRGSEFSVFLPRAAADAG